MPSPSLCPLLLASPNVENKNCVRSSCAWWAETHDAATGKKMFSGCTIAVAGAMLVQITSMLATQTATPPSTIVQPS